MPSGADANRAVYPCGPISSLDKLARTLSCGTEELRGLAAAAERLYKERLKKKKDGSTRICYDALKPLKRIQGLIKHRILAHVRFPSYVMGGVGDPDNPRDYVRNAQLHTGARVVIGEDVSNFFPSTSRKTVREIWRHFFHFSPEVADLLTALTTKGGSLPQGARTSCHLANLAFWAIEPYLVRKLAEKGFRYSRYVDDLAVSCARDCTASELKYAVSEIVSMVRRGGQHLKRKKHSIARAGAPASRFRRSASAKEKSKMRVTGLNVGPGASIPPAKRGTARALVHRCEVLAAINPYSPELPAIIRRAAGHVGQMRRLHPRQAERLKARLAAVTARGSESMGGKQLGAPGLPLSMFAGA